MEVGLFLFGLVLGVLLGWRWLGERRSIVPPAHDLEAIRGRAERAEARVRDLEAARDATEARAAAVEQERRWLAERLRRVEEEAGRAARQEVAGDVPKAAGASAPPTEGLAADGAADDLTRIKGIGRKLAGKLHSMGYTSFRQLAELTPEEMRRIDAAIEFPGRVERDRWVEQARMLMSG